MDSEGMKSENRGGRWELRRGRLGLATPVVVQGVGGFIGLQMDDEVTCEGFIPNMDVR